MPRIARQFEWRAALGPWRWMILGTLGVAPSACGGRGSSDDLDGGTADVQSPPDRAPLTGTAPLPVPTAGFGGSNAVGSGGGSASGGTAGPGAAGGVPGGGGVPPENAWPCEPESTVGGGWERCTNGMMHRAQAGACPSLLPREDHSLESWLGAPPTPDAGALYACRIDSDCSARAHGHCQLGQGGPYCAYGCVVDAECDSGQVCLCGPVIGECVLANCTVDSDCGTSALCGSYEYQPTCGGTRVACQTAEDQCGGDVDCEGTGSGYCTRELDYSADPPRESAHRSCSTDICSIGRPFLIDGVERLAPMALRSDWYSGSSAGSDTNSERPEPNAAVARGWLDQALMEHASVAAFARFSLQLLQLGAPAELVAAASTAMQDEIRHARGCFELARCYSTEDIGPGPLAIDGALEPADAVTIVLDTLREGCLGETVAAIEAAEALQHCEEPAARALLERIAREEGQHAELAWRFVAWALEARPELAPAVREAFARELAGARRSRERRPLHLAAEDRELARHGLLSAQLRAALRERVLASVVAPCADALLAGAGWKSPETAARTRDTAQPV